MGALIGVKIKQQDYDQLFPMLLDEAEDEDREGTPRTGA